MQFKSITSNFSVTSQITSSDMNDIAKAGFKSIICNRPDGEGSDQPSYVDIQAAAAKVSLHARYIPILSGQTTKADVAAFAKAVAELPGPVLAYCRTGARSTMLWDMSQNVDKKAAGNS